MSGLCHPGERWLFSQNIQFLGTRCGMCKMHPKSTRDRNTAILPKQVRGCRPVHTPFALGRAPGAAIAPRWHQPVLEHLPNITLMLVTGQYAQAWHLHPPGTGGVTDNVQRWQAFGPGVMPLRHPSPRNNIWLKRSPWLAESLLTELKLRVAQALACVS